MKQGRAVKPDMGWKGHGMVLNCIFDNAEGLVSQVASTLYFDSGRPGGHLADNRGMGKTLALEQCQYFIYRRRIASNQ